MSSFQKQVVLAVVLALVLGGVALVGAREAGPVLGIGGRVFSPQGPVAGATVKVVGGRQSTRSDPDGTYHLESFPPLYRPPVVAAGKPGFFNNLAYRGQGGSQQDVFLNPLYLADDPGYQFLSPATCFTCHGKVTRIWNQSKMSRATSNPRFLEMYYGQGPGGGKRGPGFRRDFPNSEGDCAKCHAPSAAADPARSWDPRRILSSPRTEWPGVSCDYCHKVRKVVPTRRHPAGWAPVLERQRPVRGRSILVFGPYPDTVVPPMAASYNPLFDQGRFCATCHSQQKRLPPGKKWDRAKVYSDREWAALGFRDDGSLPLQTTYQEWKSWQDGLALGHPDKGKRCQFCHMSWQKKLLPYDNYLVEGMARRMWGVRREPGDIRPHHFEGGTKAQLAGAVGLELSGGIQGRVLTIQAHVSNTNGGHWVPTGEPMRNLLLLVSARGLDDKPLKLISGPRLPAWTGRGDPQEGDYAGLPGFAFARVLADDKGNLNVPSWRATRVAADTRLRPKATRVLTFRFQLEDPDDEPAVEAKLIYRPVVRPLAKAKGWSVKDILITSKAW